MIRGKVFHHEEFRNILHYLLEVCDVTQDGNDVREIVCTGLGSGINKEEIEKSFNVK